MQPTLAAELIQKIYSADIWDGFAPGPAREVQGWYGDHPSLAELVVRPGRVLVVDVGVWKGQSTINMARSLQAAGIDGCVIAVDTFLGSAEHWFKPERWFTPTPEMPALFGRRHGRPDLYETFLSNVIHAGVRDYVAPLPLTSSAAAQLLRDLEVRPHIVHVDAAHEYEEVMRDVEAWWAMLEPGGVLIGDDYGEVWPGVVRAAGEFSARTGRPLTIRGPKWILHKQ